MTPLKPLHHMFQDAVRRLAAGNGVAHLPVIAVTTRQAADLLDVSRPFLMNSLERGEIAFHLVGRHRRIYLRDLLLFRTRCDAAARKMIDELSTNEPD